MSEISNRKVFVRIEQGMGKNNNNVLVVMHKNMEAQGRDWIRNNYGNAFLLIEEKEHESSVTLCKQKMPEK